LIPYTASLYNGLSRLFSMAFHIDYVWCIIAMSVLTGIYVIAGGYMATAINDFIQGIIMLFGIVAVILAVLGQNGGFTEALKSLAEVTDPSAPEMQVPGVFASFFGPYPTDLLAVVLLTSLGTWGLPQMVQKFYAIKSEKAIGRGTIISTMFALVVAGGCYFLGGFGRLYDIDVATAGYDAIIPTMLTHLPDVLMALVIVLVLSASMSTLSSLVLTSSSTLTLDLIKPMNPEMGEKKQVTVMRSLIAVFVAISAVIAILQYKLNLSSIAQLMGISWGALAGAFLAPFIYGLYWKRTTAAGCAASLVFGIGVMLANMLFRPYFPVALQSPINCGAFVMLAGMVIVPIVSLLTPKPVKADVDEMFSCYETTVQGPAKRFLGE
jgi:SSS family solute:Na+ symporter